MGLDYALVHVFYTIPPAVFLTLIYRPLFTRLDLYRLSFIITIAVVATIPWDAYLIWNDVWSYPAHAVLGPTLFGIPLEELFFFVIQTYNTSFLYFIFSLPTFHPIYLSGPKEDEQLQLWKWAGACLIGGSVAYSDYFMQSDGRGFYMFLILSWAGSFMLFLWLLSYQLIIQLPLTNTLLPIALPTFYLWVVDTLALKRGTWVIEQGTKLDWHIWDGLDIEEATFFAVTNILIVFGLVAFDASYAILETFPASFAVQSGVPSPILMTKALLLPTAAYDVQYLQGLREALGRLRSKSRSFYVASGVFPRAIRRDLILLYSYCRAADDLVDEASTNDERRVWISKLRRFLDCSCRDSNKGSADATSTYIQANFGPHIRLALEYLPVSKLSPRPLYDLLEGFEMDLLFSENDTKFPISSERVLQQYAARVAGTVAELCIQLVYYHLSSNIPEASRAEILSAGRQMGVALQFVNIARDIRVDAGLGRVYIPTEWVEEYAITPEDILHDPDRPQVEALRQRLLDLAFRCYENARPKIDLLPIEARGPMSVTVESYMEIGRTLRRRGYGVKDGRASVKRLRRIWVAWKALAS